MAAKKSKSPKPKNAALYSRVKAEAKRKFKVYPSAYANAYEEMTGKTINSAGVLRLEKRKTGYEFKQIDNISKHFVTFRAVLWLWRFINDPESDYLKIN